MKRFTILTVACLLFSCVFGQWVPTNGPDLPLRTYDVLSADSFLVVSTSCEPLYSIDHGNTWEYVQYNGYYGNEVNGHFFFDGKAYLRSSWRYFWTLNTSSGTPRYDPVRQFPTDVSDVVADSSGIYLATYENGLAMSPSDSNFTLYGSGLPVDSVGWDTLEHRFCNAVAINGQFVFLGTRHGVYRATKGIFQFTAINNGLPALPAMHLLCKDSVLIADVGSNLYRSGDQGQTWALSSFPPYTSCNRLQEFGDTLYACVQPGGLLYSSDQGLNWIPVDTNWAYLPIYGMAELADELYVASDKGLQKGLWPSSVLHYNGCGSIVKSVVNSNGCLAATTPFDVNFSTDMGETWSKFANRAGHQYANLVVNLDGQLFWSTQWGSANQPPALFFSDDCASSFDSLTIPGTDTQWYLSSDGAHLIANYASPEYWMFTDSGSSRTQILRPSAIECDTDPIMMVVGNAIYATSCDNTELLRTYDFGQSWTNVGSGLPFDRVCYMEKLGGRLFATFADDIYQAISGDSLWVPSKIGIPGNSGPFFDLEWDGQQYYVCNGSLVWASVDGSHWVSISQGLPPIVPQNQTYSGMTLVDSLLFVGTWGQGVWKRPISELSVGTAAVAPFLELRLFPNPAKDRLHWSAPELVKSIRCFDLQGRAMPFVENADYLDVSHWPAGLYVVQATTRGGNVLSGKVLIQR
jgi:photosystem II stability/assembly factor-like uncharacterized protein